MISWIELTKKESGVENINKLYFIKIKSFVLQRNSKIIKRQATHSQKILQNICLIKKLVSRIFKEVLQLNNKLIETQ